MTSAERTLVLFNHDWDAIAHKRLAAERGLVFDEAGFDLFSFPSNAHLAWFDMNRFVDRLARQAKARGWTGVTSNQEQFGALAAALLAERMGWPGTSVAAILACQHKLYARQALQRVAPEANVHFQLLEAEYGAPVPQGLTYPLFVKPIKAAFSVLARQVDSYEELHQHTRFGWWELWVIRRLVEPFERMARERLGADVPSAHRMLLEEPARADQFNLDGYVFKGEMHAVGVVDAIMFPDTQAFMRHEVPSRLPASVQGRALDVARRFLAEVGFTHGLFNMEFFYDAVSDRLTVIEFNPRMASQYADLYLRVQGVDMHAMALALAHGRDPASVPRKAPSAGAAASFVYRVFDPAEQVTLPTDAQAGAFAAAFPDGLLFPYPKSVGSIQRDFKWLGSYRYGITHLGGRDAADLRARCERASALLGWPAPYAEYAAHPIDADRETSHAGASPTTHTPVAPCAAGLPISGSAAKGNT
ncbi:ATP-grasp domain-containing protein [Hydrogenophaga crassostreae]|uniref:ATP-grasp domain-containing protein n=1 Tax=Hydrogenophaga crassostreae TaxID=1763535 RepID=A0A1D8NZC1_9BURK|nr:ATP-grasp domain-containing protein [Hydrogenophaga crassostreae]AOW14436.1 ATP-grasp domain-containing protein [Hydrogenophaga crassostreae]